LDPLSETSGSQDLSYLSKLQQSSLSIKDKRGDAPIGDENDSQVVNFQIKEEAAAENDDGKKNH